MYNTARAISSQKSLITTIRSTSLSKLYASRLGGLCLPQQQRFATSDTSSSTKNASAGTSASWDMIFPKSEYFSAYNLRVFVRKHWKKLAVVGAATWFFASSGVVAIQAIVLASALLMYIATPYNFILGRLNSRLVRRLRLVHDAESNAPKFIECQTSSYWFPSNVKIDKLSATPGSISLIAVAPGRAVKPTYLGFVSRDAIQHDDADDPSAQQGPFIMRGNTAFFMHRRSIVTEGSERSLLEAFGLTKYIDRARRWIIPLDNKGHPIPKEGEEEQANADENLPPAILPAETPDTHYVRICSLESLKQDERPRIITIGNRAHLILSSIDDEGDSSDYVAVKTMASLPLVQALRLRVAQASNLMQAIELSHHLSKWSISTRRSNGYLYMRYNAEEISLCTRGEERTVGQLFDLAFDSVAIDRFEQSESDSDEKDE